LKEKKQKIKKKRKTKKNKKNQKEKSNYLWSLKLQTLDSFFFLFPNKYSKNALTRKE
jgi:hypothetical protein